MARTIVRLLDSPPARLTPDQINNRKIATLRWLYRGALRTDAHWVACIACGALYDEPGDLTDCHRCQA